MHSALLHHVRALIALGLLSVAGACGGDGKEPATPDSLAGADSTEADATEALRFMAAADQGEVQAAQIGARLATDREVRQFAQLLWREHSRSGREVADLARQMEVDLQASGRPGPLVTSIQSLNQETLRLLNGTPRGPAFDRAYLDSQIRMHQAILQNLQRVVKGSGRGIGAGVAPGAGVDVGAAGSSDAAAATPAPPAARSGAASTAGRGRDRAAATPHEAARMMIPRVQEHLERARQIRVRLAGGTG